ncbi:MAG: hypothetical protein CSA39_04300 [Flavobacteriales bacterium]|nr:MAG: hypothetical protein CSA39_04300 [Flavobacteriales bacterium]
MKKKLFPLALLTLLLFSCKENITDKINNKNVELAKQRDYKMQEGAAEITFLKHEHDFGTIPEGEKAETVFEFKNTGKSALIITNAKATCGCTVPEWPKEPIAPGESGKISVIFNSKGRPGKNSKTVTLTTNTAKGKESVVIKANVTPKVKPS